jgi:hypothetical protein
MISLVVVPSAWPGSRSPGVARARRIGTTAAELAPVGGRPRRRACRPVRLGTADDANFRESRLLCEHLDRAQ